jgi:nucleoid-associated protein YgaU
MSWTTHPKIAEKSEGEIVTRSKAIALLTGLLLAVLALAGGRLWQLIAPGEVKPQQPEVAGISETAPPPQPQAERVVPPSFPQFDIVRVEPSGETIVAGRALPDTEIALMADGAVLAQGQADAAGLFVLQPEALRPGDYLLSLRMTPKTGEPRISQQNVMVSLPVPGKDPVMVALAEPGKPTILLSDPTLRRAAASREAGAPEVAFKTAEVEANKGFYASGTAAPGEHLRLYLNDSVLTDITAGADGRWSLKIAKGMAPGHYTLRADAIDATGAVGARAEIPFDFPSVLSARTAAKVSPAGPGASEAVIEALNTARVEQGDSLWRISRRILGAGTRYTEIYAANSSQIRDPKRIYPGQVFVLPKEREPEPR